MSSQKCGDIIRLAIDEYNRYRSPEANATLISVSEEDFIIKFTGYYCHTCGFYDYFEDLIYILLDYGLESEIYDVSEIEEGAVVKFRLKKLL